MTQDDIAVNLFNLVEEHFDSVERLSDGVFYINHAGSLFEVKVSAAVESAK